MELVMVHRKSGQILILVLLIVVVSLAIGLSVASRNLTNLRTSTQTEQSQRAFTAAEGGVEDILSRFNNVASIAAGGPSSGGCTNGGVGTANCAVSVGSLTANVNVQSQSTVQRTIEVGDVGQIDLSGATGTALKIEWAATGDSVETSGSGPASIEVLQIYGASPYSQNRQAFAGRSDRGSNESGFVAPSGCLPASDFQRCTQVVLQASSQLLRIRPFWAKATVRISSVGGALPTQSYVVTSTAISDNGLTRKVQVTKSAKSQLPAVFDYVLYSEGDIVK